MLRASIAAILLLAAPVPAAPVPTHLMPKTPQWFPTTVGTTWVLEINGREITETIAAVEHKNNDTFITIEYMNGNQRSPSAVLRQNKDGVCRLSIRGSEYVEPYWLIKTPARKDDKWDFTVRFQGTNNSVYGGTKSIGEPDEFTLDGRRHPAIRVITALNDSDPPLVSWYAAGLGFVKQTGRDQALMKSFKSPVK